MGLSTLGQAIAMFAVTNVDDLVILALFFGQAAGRRMDVVRVVLGQYLGFAAILAASILGSLGAGLLPKSVIPYLGLVPLLLGIRAAWRVWRERHSNGETNSGEAPKAGRHGAPGVLAVAGVTFANGGDNIGVYVPVFATVGTAAIMAYSVVFLLLVGVLVLAAKFLTTRKGLAEILERWEHILFPLVLVVLGIVILVSGGAFGL